MEYHEIAPGVTIPKIGLGTWGMGGRQIEDKRWDEEKVYLQSKGGMPIDCFYHIYAERKDINPLHVEYEGNSWRDYPDPNHINPNIEDKKRNLLDPKYRGPRNTITK